MALMDGSIFISEEEVARILALPQDEFMDLLIRVLRILREAEEEKPHG